MVVLVWLGWLFGGVGSANCSREHRDLAAIEFVFWRFGSRFGVGVGLARCLWCACRVVDIECMRRSWFRQKVVSHERQ